MKANKTRPVLDDIPSSTGKAALIPFSRLPRLDRELIALCSASFEEFLERNNAQGERRFRVQEGGGCRLIGAALTTGRHAMLEKRDSVAEFWISLETWRDFHVFRDDFYEVFKLLAVPSSTIQFCDGPVHWR